MIPKSLSASALQVAESCPARYHAEYILRASRPQNNAAALGTTVHAALEWYVKAVYLEGTKQESLSYLLELFRMHFAAEFATFDTDSEEYKDGVDMLTRWFGRTKFDDRTVVSCEVKTSFPIPTSIGDIPFNYIWDRFDQIGDDEYEVVDYKSIRVGFGPSELRNKIQARIYSLMARILKPNAKRIWVTFDLLRHEGPVSIVFTRDDDAATWNYLLDMAEKIIATPDTDLPETLNNECRWCVRKVSCGALMSNTKGGGSLDKPAEELIDIRAMIEYQKKAIEEAAREIDKIIMEDALRDDRAVYESKDNVLQVSWSSRRAVDPERVLQAVGARLFDKYDGPLMTYTTFSKLLKDKEVDAEMRERLKALVYSKRGEPYLKVSPRNPID